MNRIQQLEHELEENPVVQIKFHKRMMKVWAINAPIISLLYIVTFFVSERTAIAILSFISFYTAMVSLYANWVSDFDGLSAAQSTLETIKQNRKDTATIVDNPTDQPKTLDDLIMASQSQKLS